MRTEATVIQPGEVQIDKLKVCAPRSPYGALKDSILEHGVVVPIVILANPRGGYFVVDGNQRVLATREIGLKTIPYIHITSHTA